MIFRKAKESDANKLDSLLTKLILDEKNYDPNVELVDVKDFYINYINDNTKYFEVCEEENNIVGYIYCIIDGSVAKIDALYIEESYRNRKIGNTLITNFINYARNNGIKSITINVLNNNVKAKHLYYKFFKLNQKDEKKEELTLNL